MQKWIASLNIGFVILIITFLALIFSSFASFKLAKVSPKSTPRNNVATSSKAVIEDLTSFSIILERGLFGRATQGKINPLVTTGANVKGGQLSLAPGDFLLLGTVVGSHRETFALIQKATTKEERVFRLGDKVFDAGSLISVKRDAAELLLDGKRVTVYTPMAVVSGTPVPTQQGLPAADSKGSGLATATGSGNYVIDQRALDAALDNIGKAMTDARLLPSLKDGKVEGFRASEVKPQGVFGMIGMKNGDILLRINDFPIDSPEKAIQSFATLKGQSRIKLDMIRDGQPTTFNYEIR